MIFSARVIEEKIQGKYLTAQIASNAGCNSSRPRTEKQTTLEDQIFIISYHCKLFSRRFLSSLLYILHHSQGSVLRLLKSTAIASKCYVLGFTERIKGFGFSFQLYKKVLMHTRLQWSEHSKTVLTIIIRMRNQTE